MKRYKIYYDGFDKLFCQMDVESGEVFDASGKTMQKFPDYVYEQWVRGGGRIEERNYMIGQEPQRKKIQPKQTSKKVLKRRRSRTGRQVGST